MVFHFHSWIVPGLVRLCACCCFFFSSHYISLIYIPICGYAPHEALSNNKPEERDIFYNDIQKALALKKSTTIPILALDANTQIAYNNQESPNHGILGKFTKATKTNNNGQKLLRIVAENELTITNTIFQHNMSHRTT